MNKRNDEIDAIIKDVINKENIPNAIYQDAFNNLDKINPKNFKHKPINKFIKIAACISIIVCISALGTALLLRNDKPIIENNIANENNKNDESIKDSTDSYAEDVKLPVATKSIYLNIYESEAPGKFVSPMEIGVLVEDSQYIAVVHLNQILSYTNYQPATNKYTHEPFTVSKVTTKKEFKGSLPKEFEMITWGGVLSLSQYEKGAYREEILKMGLDKMSEKEKNETYINCVSLMTMYMPKLKEGKDYLVYMRYNKAFEKNQVLDYFIYEYDIENDRILNHETNEWIDFTI